MQEKKTSTLSRRLWLALFLRSFCGSMLLVCCLSGLLILLFRLFSLFDVSSCQLLLAGSLLPFISAGYAAWDATRKKPTDTQLLLWMEHAAHAGGLLATSTERDISDWTQKIPQLPSVSFTANIQTRLLSLCLSLLFLVGSCLIPIFQPKQPTLPHKMDIQQEVGELQEKLGILEQESIIPPQTAQQLRQSLEDLQQSNNAEAPAKTFDQLADITKRLGAFEKNAIEDLTDKIKTTSNLQDLLTSLGDTENKQAMTEFEQLLNDLAERDPALQKALQQALEGKPLAPGALESIQQALGALSQQQKDALSRMMQDKLTPQAPQQSTSPVDPQELQQWLETLGAEYPNLEATCCQGGSQATGDEGSQPGNGSPTRGPGAAPLDFSGKSPDFQGPYTDHAIAGMPDPQASTKLFTTTMAPEDQHSFQEAAQTGALQMAPTTGLKQQNAPILPKHKKAVQDFFTHETP